MKYILTLIAGLCCMHLSAQEKCSAVIDWHYLKPIQVYDSPDGNSIYSIQNDSAKEDYVHVRILDQTENWFYISNTNRAKEEKTGWIKKESYIGTYKRHERSPMTLVMYKERNVAEKNKIVIEDWYPVLLTIVSCENSWVYVSFYHKESVYTGWFPANELCSNYYTYCN